jgi:hypothetical protein
MNRQRAASTARTSSRPVIRNPSGITHVDGVQFRRYARTQFPLRTYAGVSVMRPAQTMPQVTGEGRRRRHHSRGTGATVFIISLSRTDGPGDSSTPMSPRCEASTTAARATRYFAVTMGPRPEDWPLRRLDVSERPVVRVVQVLRGAQARLRNHRRNPLLRTPGYNAVGSVDPDNPADYQVAPRQ